jgi:hypothetical protein
MIGSDARQLRRGTSTAEVFVAIALLGTAMVGIGQFAVTTQQGLRQRELSTRLSAELLNARERIGAWPTEKITVERIEQLPFSAALAEQVDEPQWRASVESVSQPTSALRVTLRLHCTLQGQPAAPQALTFWVAR